MNNEQINSRKFPALYTALGIKIEDLGCIMLDVEPIEVTKHVEGGEDDLFFGDIPPLKFAQGAVAEKSAHVTLQFGLLEKGSIWKNLVDQALEGWNVPSVRISSVGFFLSNIEGQDYTVIVGHIDVTDQLLEGHHRLQLLPHIDTFPEYKPHVTLAYIKNGPSRVNWAKTAREKWVTALNKHYQGRNLRVLGINYGDTPEG